MQTATTVRRLLPEIVLVAVTAVAVGALLTVVGGKEAADSDATAWRAQQNTHCTTAAAPVAAARQLLEENSAATRGEGAPDAPAVNGLISGAGRMSEAIRLLAAEYRASAVPDRGVDRARAERVLTHAGVLDTAWNSLAAEYEDLETRPENARARIAEWSLRAEAAAEQLRRAFADVDLTSCDRLAESMGPVS